MNGKNRSYVLNSFIIKNNVFKIESEINNKEIIFKKNILLYY